MAVQSKLTPAVHAALVRAFSLGASVTAAAAAAGVTRQILYVWRERAQEGKQPYKDLFTDIEIAEGQRVQRWLAQIEKAASEGNWTAAAWKLERLYPAEFSLRSKLDVTLSVETMSDEELDQFISAASQPALLSSGRTRETKAS